MTTQTRLAAQLRDRTVAAGVRPRAACRPARERNERFFRSSVHLDRDHSDPGRDGHLDLRGYETGGIMRIEKRGMHQHQALAVRACLGLLLLFLAAPARSQDIGVNCSQNATCQLTPSGGIPWANGNLTWIFKPINPHVSIYIFIRNYNPTSSHTSQTVTVC